MFVGGWWNPDEPPTVVGGTGTPLTKPVVTITKTQPVLQPLNPTATVLAKPTLTPITKVATATPQKVCSCD